jgi:hypothetical protein
VTKQKKMPSYNKRSPGWWLLCLVLLLTVFATSPIAADEKERRRVDISLSIFPRIVAVDNHFREKLGEDKSVRLFFLYDKDRENAEDLAQRMNKSGQGIGGREVLAEAVSVDKAVLAAGDELPMAIFVTEHLGDARLLRAMLFAEKYNRLVFSPFTGDVERGVTVGISVTNRVKPYFNMHALQRSKIAINALLMKMSRRYE